MARRGENIFRRKDGRWEARVSEHRENGNKIYRSLYGKSYTEVKAKERRILWHSISGRNTCRKETCDIRTSGGMLAVCSQRNGQRVFIYTLLSQCA